MELFLASRLVTLLYHFPRESFYACVFMVYVADKLRDRIPLTKIDRNDGQKCKKLPITFGVV